MTNEEAIAMFMDLVDCTREQVKDIPADRIGVDPTYIPETRRKHSRGTIVLFFGKHRGKRLNEIPRDYLEWFVAQPALQDVSAKTGKSLEKHKNFVREYLGMKPRWKRQPRTANRT